MSKDEHSSTITEILDRIEQQLLLLIDLLGIQDEEPDQSENYR